MRVARYSGRHGEDRVATVALISAMMGPANAQYGSPAGMPTTHADTINADLLAFVRS